MINIIETNNLPWAARATYLIDKSALYTIIDLLLHTEDNSDMYFEKLIKNETFGQMNEKKLIRMYISTHKQKMEIIDGYIEFQKREQSLHKGNDTGNS